MILRIPVTIIVRILFISLLLFTGGASVFAHGDVTHSIRMTDDGFEPAEMSILVGDTIKFVNDGKNEHWPASNIHPTHSVYPEFDSLQGVLPAESWSFTFTKSGTWRFHDHMYADFVGRIIVDNDETDTATSTVDKPSTLSQFFEVLQDRIIDTWHTITHWFSELFEPEITADTTEIFTNKDKLRTYISTYGTKKTIEHLHELSALYGSCHTAAHETGHIAYELFGAKAFQECPANCHSGCYHGAIEAHFKENGTANIAEDLKLICNGELNAFFSHQCMHGVGHGIMAWSDYELPEALAVCDTLPVQGQASCQTGVFMENIVGGLAGENGAEDQKVLAGHFTKYLSDDPHYPCNSLEEKYQGTCYFLQTSRMMQLFKSDFRKISAACAEAPTLYQQSCFGSMGRDIGGVFRQNHQGAINACEEAPQGDAQTWCFTGAVLDTFWDETGQDEALKFCTLVPTTDAKTKCYQTISAQATQILPLKEQQEAFCKKAESSYVSLCEETQALSRKE